MEESKTNSDPCRECSGDMCDACFDKTVVARRARVERLLLSSEKRVCIE